jgi:tryptophan aminotransferase
MSSLSKTRLANPSEPSEILDIIIHAISRLMHGSQVRGLLTLESIPGVLSLLMGKPAQQTFPITSISINVRSQESPSEEITLKIDSQGGQISEALQYGPTNGHKSLITWLLTLQKHYHGRSEDPSWTLSVGAGSQDLLYKAFLALNNPGDSVLIEVTRIDASLDIIL